MSIAAKRHQSKTYLYEICLALAKQLLQSPNLKIEAVAILTDKVSIAQGKSQVFGTQADFIKSKVVFAPIENEDSVDQLRAQMGMPSLAEYKKILEAL
jgi:hypothetical protein